MIAVGPATAEMSPSGPEAAMLMDLARRLTGIDQITEQAFLQLGSRIEAGQKRIAGLAQEAATLLDQSEDQSSSYNFV